MDWVKVDGVWKETDAIFVKVSDVWKEAEQVYANSGGSWVEGWTGMTEPILQHTAQGEFTVVDDETSLRKTTTYAVFRSNGEITTAGVNGNVISLGDLYGEFYVSDYRDTELKKATRFYRERVTYNYVAVPPTCTDNCGLAYDCVGSPVPNCQPCWGSGSDGTYCCGGICCGGSRGQTCTDNPDRPVKNPVPDGFTERYSEWVRIENPTTTREIKEKDVGAFAITKVQWDNNYYMEVPMPPPHPAQVIDEDTGAPTGEVLENVPAWDYTNISFIHYDNEGNIVWAMDNVNNRECFTIVEKEPMRDYEMWVSHLPPAYEGTYEFTVSNSEEVFIREVGDV